MKQIRIIAIAIAFLSAGLMAQAQNTFTIAAEVTGTTSLTTTRTFTITRTGNTRIQEKVLYRTVSLTALEDHNFTKKTGSITFEPGESSKTVNVTEKALGVIYAIYKYQFYEYRNYRFEVTDEAGFTLASRDVTLYYDNKLNPDRITTGGYNHILSDLVSFNDGNYDSSVNGAKFQDISYDPASNNQHVMSEDGYIKIDDSYNYNNKTLCTIPTASIFNYAKGSPAYHNAVGNMLYATVCFTMKESDDGYQYIQILTDNSTTYDGSGDVQDPNGQVNDPSESIYKACFELSRTGSVVKKDSKMAFPLKSDTAEGSAYFGYAYAGLYQQKFKSHTPSYRAEDSGSLVLDPRVETISVRFDASGNHDDTWWVKNIFVRMALYDNVAPSLLQTSIVVSPGPHAKGNTVTIGIPFSEAVNCIDDTYELATTWGTFRVANTTFYKGTNVVYFTGEITANAGTKLEILHFVPEEPIINDLCGKCFVGSVYKPYNNLEVDAPHEFSINYVTDGGTVNGSYPKTFTHGSAALTLPINVTKTDYLFAGWYDNPNFEGERATTVPANSYADKTYYAKWTQNTLEGAGTQNNPYIISTKEDLDLISLQVDLGNSYNGKYFRLDNDIEFPYTMEWDGTGTENNFLPIACRHDDHGNHDNSFDGIFDGGGHTISGIRIYRNGDYCGLFGAVGGTVKNLVISNSSIVGNKFTGAVAGYANGYIENCKVTSNVRISNPSGGEYKYHGGVVGGKASHNAISGCISSARLSTSGATDNGGEDFGGIAGEMFNSGIIKDCFSTGVTFPAAKYFKDNSLGAISGENGFKCTFINNYYINCHIYNSETSVYGVAGSDMDGARMARAISTDEYVTVTPTGAYTEYDVSGITAYECGAMAVGGVLYSGSTQTIGITLSHTNRPGYTFAGYSVQNGTLEGNDTDGYTLTIGNGDVTISALWGTSVTAKPADGGFWTTFYHPTLRFTLPEGAQAFTMAADHQLYRLGADGRSIPAATAVVIIGQEASLLLTISSDTAAVTIHGDGTNILQGSGSDVSVSSLGGSTPYVLGKVNGKMGFYHYTGASIPAGKAYYVVD